MTNIVFRRAQRSDLPDIVALLADDVIGRSREDASLPINNRYVDAFEALQRDSNQLLAVAVDGDDVVVGCVQISFIPGLSRLGMWRGQIESVRIASGHRGEGLGRRLFEWAIAQCRNRGCGLVQLTTDKTRPDALRFYESLGFRASHEGMKLDL
jgi:ribosomal protein S18 acetylase RimI-like enzyme